MDGETQAKMVLALADAVDSLVEQATHQQKAVQGVLTTGGEALKAVALAGNEHRTLAKDLPKQVKEAITEALDGAAAKAAGILSSNFTDADEQARLAADRYERAARTLRWKLIAGGVGAWAVTVAVMALVVWYASAEVKALYEDRTMLATTLAYLKQNPQGAQIRLCNSRNNFQDLCVYVQTAQNKSEWQRLAKRPEKDATP